VVGIKIGQIKVMLLWLSKNYAQNENCVNDENPHRYTHVFVVVGCIRFVQSSTVNLYIEGNVHL
jgi:hypothetical protein